MALRLSWTVYFHDGRSMLCIMASVLNVIFSLFCDAFYIKCSESAACELKFHAKWARQYGLFNLT